MNDEWEDVEVPQGTFVGWGEVGQTITMEVVSYGENAGMTKNGVICPQIVGILTVDAVNYRDNGKTKGMISKGEFATITCSQVSLNRAIRAAAVEPGNLVRIKYEGIYETKQGTEGKAFKVQVNRSKRGVPVDDLC